MTSRNQMLLPLFCRETKDLAIENGQAADQHNGFENAHFVNSPRDIAGRSFVAAAGFRSKLLNLVVE
jgi:hypothetical protein